HYDAENAGQHHDIVNIWPAADILEPAKDRGAHGNLVKDAALHLGSVLEILEDRVMPARHELIFDDRILAGSGDVIVLELGKWPLILAVVRRNVAFEHDLRVR